MDPIQTINTQQFKRSVQQTDVDSSPKTSKARDIQLREASRKLEASFLTQMVKALEKTVPKSGLTGSRNTLASMLFSTVMGDALAQANPTGLSNMFYHSLQEKMRLRFLRI